ncbi:MAG: HDOD domain-containing protein [Methylotenera sp.]|nr:HDOD domain-containing protein [Methylotenera sp.]MDO9232318.1 HDOD domain-containing protein [Methylotenera sp.]MDO9388142.1 HDOD domain-containing protein [Methylotenera sp.]MDP2102152.1 HDOD domain-containing protein [Methylotenera sp.]MDP2281112.1 HDOD domain-containing protein [Methylotenera sp.]
MASVPVELAAKDINAWVDYISTAAIPVLKLTARELGQLQQDEDNISARAIATVVHNDPMMVFKVLSYSQKHRSRSQLQDLVEVEQAILMMGTSAFFRNIPPTPLVEDTLKANLQALMHLLRLIRRAHRAAKFAAEWAAHLMDLHAEEVLIATLLHDLSEMLMWCYAPDKMNAMCAMQAADKSLRSKAVQQEVLGFQLQELQQRIVEVFQLPPLLSKLMQDQASQEQRVLNVRFAVNLARHSANGWDDAALPDDYRDIAQLLRMDVDKVMRVIGVPATI